MNGATELICVQCKRVEATQGGKRGGNDASKLVILQKAECVRGEQNREQRGTQN